MLFNSYLFIFIFLPAVLLGWYGLNKLKRYKLAELFLAGMSIRIICSLLPAAYW